MIVSTRMTSTGTLDASYGVGGIVTVAINGAAGVDSGAGLALQSDGKILIAGCGRSGGGGPISFAAVRLLPDGSLDASFGAGGVRTVPIGAEAIANAVVIQSDGKIVSAGVASMGHNEFAAVRLNADGTTDSGFGTGGTVTLSPGAAWGMVLQPDGKLVLAGQASRGGGSQGQAFMAARLLADGTLDARFGQAGIVTVPIGATSYGFGIALQSDGRLVLAGPAFTTTGVAAAARLNEDGTLDPSFGSGGIATLKDWQGVNGIILDSSGRIVLPAVGASAVAEYQRQCGHELRHWWDRPGSSRYPRRCERRGDPGGWQDRPRRRRRRQWSGRPYCDPAVGRADPVEPGRAGCGAGREPADTRPGEHRRPQRAVRTRAIASPILPRGRSTPIGGRFSVSRFPRSPRSRSASTRMVAGHSTRDVALTRRVAAGTNRFLFRMYPGLRPGFYAGAITAHNATGQASRTLPFVFAIRRPKRSW